MKSYNYVLLDLDKPGRYTYGEFITFLYEPFYVGKGAGNRMFAHFRERLLKYDKNKWKTNKIKKLLLKYGGSEIAMRINTHLPDYIVKNCVEPFLITIIGRRDKHTGPLTNMTDGGDGSNGRNIPHTEEWKRRMSVIMTGKTHSEETRQKISQVKTGVPLGPFSDEHKQKLSIAASSRTDVGPLSEEHKQKISLALSGRSRGPLSDEHKRNISEAKRGKSTITEDGRKRLSEAGHRPHSEEAKQKISLARKGKPGNGINTKWVTDGLNNKRINENRLSDFLHQGWTLGKTDKRRQK